MANLNKVMLIGRLTRDPEARSFSNGGKVANFGFAVNNRRKNSQTGQWEDDPVFLDCEAFNRGDNGTLADRVADTLRKGAQIFIEGHLKLDKWDDKQTGQKREKIKIVVDNFQYLEARGEGGGNMGGGAQRSQGGPPRRPAPSDDYDRGEPDMDAPAPNRGGEEDIPF